MVAEPEVLIYFAIAKDRNFVPELKLGNKANLMYMSSTENVHHHHLPIYPRWRAITGSSDELSYFSKYFRSKAKTG